MNKISWVASYSIAFAIFDKFYVGGSIVAYPNNYIEHNSMFLTNFVGNVLYNGVREDYVNVEVLASNHEFQDQNWQEQHYNGQPIYPNPTQQGVPQTQNVAVQDQYVQQLNPQQPQDVQQQQVQQLTQQPQEEVQQFVEEPPVDVQHDYNDQVPQQTVDVQHAYNADDQTLQLEPLDSDQLQQQNPHLQQQIVQQIPPNQEIDDQQNQGEDSDSSDSKTFQAKGHYGNEEVITDSNLSLTKNKSGNSNNSQTGLQDQQQQVCYLFTQNFKF